MPLFDVQALNIQSLYNLLQPYIRHPLHNHIKMIKIEFSHICHNGKNNRIRVKWTVHDHRYEKSLQNSILNNNIKCRYQALHSCMQLYGIFHAAVKCKIMTREREFTWWWVRSNTLQLVWISWTWESALKKFSFSSASLSAFIYTRNSHYQWVQIINIMDIYFTMPGRAKHNI